MVARGLPSAAASDYKNNVMLLVSYIGRRIMTIGPDRRFLHIDTMFIDRDRGHQCGRRGR